MWELLRMVAFHAMLAIPASNDDPAAAGAAATVCLHLVDAASAGAARRAGSALMLYL